MAGRIRTVKPEWLEDERLAAASDAARLLSVALLLLADDHGNGRAHPAYIASQAWSYGDPHETLRKASDALTELAALRFVELYDVAGQRYYHVRNWEKHQKVQHPGSPRVPLPSDGCSVSHEVLTKASGEPHEVLTPDLRSPISDLRPRPGDGPAAPEPSPHKAKPQKPKPDAEPDTLPGLDLEAGKPESPEQVGWRTWRDEYPKRYKRPYRKQDGDGPAMKRLAAAALETLRDLGREREPEALERLLRHTWRRFLADAGSMRPGDREGYLERTCHRLRDCNAGLAAYGTPWDRDTKPANAPQAKLDVPAARSGPASPPVDSGAVPPTPEALQAMARLGVNLGAMRAGGAR